MYIYKLLNEPNMNSQKLVDLIKNTIPAIQELKLQIKDCDKAFTIIDQSIYKCINNMDKYYKIFKLNKKLEDMFNEYINDLSSSEIIDNINLDIIAQFKKIIQEIKQMSKYENNIDLNSLFNYLDNTFKILENNM